jgi:hypothetical protein
MLLLIAGRVKGKRKQHHFKMKLGLISSVWVVLNLNTVVREISKPRMSGGHSYSSVLSVFLYGRTISVYDMPR